MLGQVLQFDEATGTGHVTDADGNVYQFAIADVKGAAPLDERQSVLFQPSGTRAFDIEPVAVTDRASRRQMAGWLRAEGWFYPADFRPRCRWRAHSAYPAEWSRASWRCSAA